MALPHKAGASHAKPRRIERKGFFARPLALAPLSGPTTRTLAALMSARAGCCRDASHSFSSTHSHTNQCEMNAPACTVHGQTHRIVCCFVFVGAPPLRLATAIAGSSIAGPSRPVPLPPARSSLSLPSPRRHRLLYDNNGSCLRGYSVRHSQICVSFRSDVHEREFCASRCVCVWFSVQAATTITTMMTVD